MKECLISAVVTSSNDMNILETFVTETYGSLSFRYCTFDFAILSIKVVSHNEQE